MAFETAADFFAMGTHGVYVWSAYIIGLAAFGGLFLSTRMSQKRLKQQLKKRYQREQSR